MRSRIFEGSSESYRTTAIQPGDLVVLTRDGCNRSTNELMAIWTVKNVRDDSAMVEKSINQSFNRSIKPLQICHQY